MENWTDDEIIRLAKEAGFRGLMLESASLFRKFLDLAIVQAGTLFITDTRLGGE